MGGARKLAAILLGGPTEAADPMTQTLDAQLADLKLQIDGLVRCSRKRVGSSIFRQSF
jgi:hypothetical protein